MKWTTPLLSLVVLCQLAGQAAAESDKTAEQWIDQLRANDFDQRKIASMGLEQQGESARAALLNALHDRDAEVRSAAGHLLEKLSRATLRLRVFDISGKPLSDAEGSIVLYEPFPQFRNRRAKASERPVKLNADGECDFKLESMGLLRFQCKFPGFLDNDNEWNAIELHSGLNVRPIDFKRGGSLNGKILDVAGQPVKNATVTLYSDMRFDADIFELQYRYIVQTRGANGNGAGPTAMSGEDGAWHLETVPEGVYTCVAEAPGYSPALIGTVRVREGTTTAAPNGALKERIAGKIALKFLKKADGAAASKENVTVFLAPILPETDNAVKKRWIAAIRNLPLINENRETSEIGGLEIDDLAPGKYKLVIRSEAEPDKPEGRVLIKAEIDVKSGETVTPEQTKASAVEEPLKASIKGRIMAESGGAKGTKGIKGIQVHAFTEEYYLALLAAGQNQASPPPVVGVVVQQDTTSDSKGVYRFENLPPGKYAIAFNSDDNLLHGFVFGIDTSAGEKALAPEVVLKREAVSQVAELKGRVLMPDGSPGANVSVVYYRAGVSNEFQTNEDGSFDFTVQHQSTPPGMEGVKEYLILRHEECKPVLIEDPFKADIVCKLSYQTYGSVRVTVVNEFSTPLPGVKVGTVIDNENPFAQVSGAHGFITNAKGIANLTGIATGHRNLAVTIKGFYLPSRTAPVDVATNTETEITLTLRTGAAINGRVKLPVGHSPAKTVVTLDDYHVQPVGPNGEFSFFGITPGKHTISAISPGLVGKDAIVFTIPYDPEKLKAAIPRDPVIELVERGGIAIDCGKEFAGFPAQLTPVEPLDPALSGTNVATGFVDGSGRAEFWGVVPGQYRMSVTVAGDALESAASAALVASPSCGPFDVKPATSAAALAELPAVKATLKRGNGSVSGTIRAIARPGTNDMDRQGIVNLKLQGASAAFEGELNDSLDTFFKPLDSPLLFGTVPKDFKPHVAGTFEIGSLPPGDYTLCVTMQFADEDLETPTHEASSKRVVSFKLKEGEVLDLGELKLESSEKIAPYKPADELKNFLQPSDKPREFEP